MHSFVAHGSSGVGELPLPLSDGSLMSDENIPRIQPVMLGKPFLLPDATTSKPSIYRHRCLVCSVVLHTALCLIGVFLMSGGSGGFGAGEGIGFGDGFGTGDVSIAGYINLAGGTPFGNDQVDDSGFKAPEHPEAVQDAPSRPDTVQDLLPLNEPSALPETEQSASKPLEAIPIPTPESVPEPLEHDPQPQKKIVAEAETKRRNTVTPQASSKKNAKINKASSSDARAGSRGAPADKAGKLVGELGQGGREASGQGQGGGGNAADSDKGGGSGASGFGYALNMVDTMPRVLKKGTAPYPESAKRKRLSGDVVVRFLLSEKGEISHVQVVHAEPPEVFNDAALATIQKWKFSPAIKDGKPVPVWVELPMHFSLR